MLYLYPFNRDGAGPHPAQKPCGGEPDGGQPHPYYSKTGQDFIYGGISTNVPLWLKERAKT
ncbi:MAG: hypothetical protein M3Y39_02000 [Chloroflexota bacterium]|nr:hypothetical protein [Chloroflexota bacterium]